MENTKLVKETAQKLLDQLKVEGEIEVEEKEQAFNVEIKTEDTGILIGYHGETLISFQLILALLVYKARLRLSSGDEDPASKKVGSWLKIVVNVGDWRERREESLRLMAQQAAERVVSTGEAITYPNLSSFERRIMHMALAEHSQVTTESEGEGNERKLIIKPR